MQRNSKLLILVIVSVTNKPLGEIYLSLLTDRGLLEVTKIVVVAMELSQSS